MKPKTLRFSSLRIFGLLIAATALLVSCGGGGGGGGVSAPPNNMTQPLATQMLKGSPGFVNASGFTVYVFDADLAAPGHSVCNSACAANWPPVAPPTTNLPMTWSMITRSDNTMQLTYNGRPLYTFSFDTHPGDTNGDGVTAFGGLWHIARPLASGGGSPAPTAMPSGY